MYVCIHIYAWMLHSSTSLMRAWHQHFKWWIKNKLFNRHWPFDSLWNVAFHDILSRQGLHSHESDNEQKQTFPPADSLICQRPVKLWKAHTIQNDGHLIWQRTCIDVDVESSVSDKLQLNCPYCTHLQIFILFQCKSFTWLISLPRITDKKTESIFGLLFTDSSSSV